MYKQIIESELTPPSHFDPFQGHVRGWQAMLFVYILLDVLILGMAILMLRDGFSPVTADNTERQVVSFNHWALRRVSPLEFYTTDGVRYQVSYAMDQMAPVKAACATGEAFAVHVRKVQSSSGPTHYRVFCLTSADGEQVYMSFDDANKEKRTDGIQTTCFFLAILLLWNAFVIRSIQVARHPGRYSEKTILRYFKPGVVK